MVNPKVPQSARLQKEKFPPSINVYWQRKGYFDTDTCFAYAKDYKSQAKRGEKLHQMDNLSGQAAPEFRKFLREETGTLIAFTPPGCTDLAAACDAGLIKDVKSLVKQRFEEDFEERVDDWSDGKISAREFRLLIATWLDEAWQEYFQNGGQVKVVNTFQRVGLLNAFDGSEDNLVKVQGVENYSFVESSDSEEESSSDSDWSEEDENFSGESDSMSDVSEVYGVSDMSESE